jgi:hypothetical protein
LSSINDSQDSSRDLSNTLPWDLPRHISSCRKAWLYYSTGHIIHRTELDTPTKCRRPRLAFYHLCLYYDLRGIVCLGVASGSSRTRGYKWREKASEQVFRGSWKRLTPKRSGWERGGYWAAEESGSVMAEVTVAS